MTLQFSARALRNRARLFVFGVDVLRSQLIWPPDMCDQDGYLHGRKSAASLIFCFILRTWKHNEAANALAIFRQERYDREIFDLKYSGNLNTRCVTSPFGKSNKKNVKTLVITNQFLFSYLKPAVRNFERIDKYTFSLSKILKHPPCPFAITDKFKKIISLRSK